MKRESLSELVEMLKDRLDGHAHKFRDNEALTRYALIDPLLRKLGWDTEDPNEVRPEFRVNGKSADYVLFVDREPVIVVESKKLGQPLGTTLAQGRENVKQARQNAKSARAKYFLLTDGRRYELYKTGGKSACGKFDLRGSSSAEFSLKALGPLWRPSVQSNTDIRPTLPTTDGHNWEPLAEITFEKRPVMLRLPDCSKEPIKRWNDLLTETTDWLIKNNRLDRKSLKSRPIMRRDKPGNSTVVVTTQAPPKGEEKKFTKVLAGIWVRTDYTPENCVLNAISIIKRAPCHHPSQFSVRFS